MEATKRLRRADNRFVAADRMKHDHAIAIGYECSCVLGKAFQLLEWDSTT